MQGSRGPRLFTILAEARPRRRSGREASCKRNAGLLRMHIVRGAESLVDERQRQQAAMGTQDLGGPHCKIAQCRLPQSILAMQGVPHGLADTISHDAWCRG